MKKTILIFATLFFATINILAQTPEPTSVVSVTPVTQKNETYKFKLFLLIKGAMKKNLTMPGFAYRKIKSYPLKVKEFVYPGKYSDARGKALADWTDKMLADIPVKKRNNGIYLVRAVFEYIETSISDREYAPEPLPDAHSGYFTAAQVFENKTGNMLEKCRLAVAMLRRFTIPARIVSWKGDYAVEFFIKPLDNQGKGVWHTKAFTKGETGEEKYTMPSDWHPVSSGELLDAEWKGNTISIRKIREREIFYTKKEEVLAMYTSVTLTAGDVFETTAITTTPKEFYSLREVEYEVVFKTGDHPKIRLTLPFNNVEELRTAKFFVRPEAGLKVKYKRAVVEAKPPQEGMIYALPLEFFVETEK
ncbi:MAG: transglutaminase family protein [bacterium]